MADPTYTTEQDEDGDSLPQPGEFEDDQDPADRTPQPGSAPAPGQRPSESGSAPSDLPTDAD